MREVRFQLAQPFTLLLSPFALRDVVVCFENRDRRTLSVAPQ
jgi:hypothetical protein